MTIRCWFIPIIAFNKLSHPFLLSSWVQLGHSSLRLSKPCQERWILLTCRHSQILVISTKAMLLRILDRIRSIQIAFHWIICHHICRISVLSKNNLLTMKICFKHSSKTHCNTTMSSNNPRIIKYLWTNMYHLELILGKIMFKTK